MTTAGHVLVVDDEKAQRDILTVILEGEGYTVETASNVSQALSAYRNHRADVVLTDLSMPERDGLALLEELIKLDPEALVILVTAYGTIGSAVQAMKKGAFDYLAKPVDREELLITIARAFERLHLVKENRRLQQQLLDTFKVENIIGHHPLMSLAPLRRWPPARRPSSSRARAAPARNSSRGDCTRTVPARTVRFGRSTARPCRKP
jgi:DNA-binding NtrC family response regulator